MDWAYVGAFDVTGLTPGPHTLELTAQGCQKQQVQVSVGGDVSGVLVPMPRE
ncbi:MAG: hypothetical protein KDB61_11465 [Planctomycetes bacterium]|nr:hypothetical protein [Planctomycetota bacterium]